MFLEVGDCGQFCCELLIKKYVRHSYCSLHVYELCMCECWVYECACVMHMCIGNSWVNMFVYVNAWVIMFVYVNVWVKMFVC